MGVPSKVQIIENEFECLANRRGLGGYLSEYSSGVLIYLGHNYDSQLAFGRLNGKNCLPTFKTTGIQNYRNSKLPEFKTTGIEFSLPEFMNSCLLTMITIVRDSFVWPDVKN